MLLAFLTPVGVAAVKDARGRSGVVFEYSWEHDNRRRENAWKLIPAILSGICGLIVGIVLMYLKHKFGL
jgi:hypothetical protein